MEPPVEIDYRLQAVSDTSIVLNFAHAIEAIYPNLKAVYAHCYDPYDDVVEPLFHALVYGSFAGKYGIPTPPKLCHKYDSVGGDYQKLAYVRVRLGEMPVHAQKDGEQFVVTEDIIKGRELVFKTFGDGLHCLTAGELEGDPYEVRFNMTEIELVNLEERVRSFDQSITTFWVSNDAVEFEFAHGGAR